jgi:hypothetical protein
LSSAKSIPNPRHYFKNGSLSRNARRRLRAKGQSDDSAPHIAPVRPQMPGSIST